MTFATLSSEALRIAYDTLGESVTVDGADVTAIFDVAYSDALGIAGDQIALRCIASDISGVAVGDSVVRDSVTYTVRIIQKIPPDGLETRLVLEAA